jgi:GxxExxY protein
MDGSDELNELTGQIIEAAFKVHRRLGPGLLEHVYKKCLAHELGRTGLKVATEVSVSLRYDELLIESAYRLDVLVEDSVIVEIKAVEKVLPVHHAQLLTYLKLENKPVGLFLNFNTKRLSDDLKRIAHNL